MKHKTPASKISASVLVTIALIVLSYLLLPKVHSIGAARTLPRKNADAAARAADKRARMALGGLPLSFEMNRGQFDGQVKFASRGAGYKTFLTQSETVFVLRKPEAKKAAEKNLVEKTKGATRAERLAERKRLRAERAAERAASKSVVRMSLAGGNVAPQVTGMDELPGKINYFRGRDQQKWITDVPTFHRVHFASVYPGIDLVYYGQGRQLEYDFVVAPGADASRIGFDFEGAERVEVDPGTGGLVVHAAGGAQLRQGKPVFYQESNGVKQPISGGFTVSGNRAGFTVGDYDKTRPLVIDPVVFTYSTYLGAEDNDRGHDIVADADGNAYAAGWTESEEFPTKDAVQPGNNDDSDEAFITKFNPGGYALIWSTYLGGGDTGNEGGADEGAYGVALDAARNVYVTGFTFSRDFPTKDAMQPQLSDACCDSDSFITKIAASGNQLVFSTYFGGSDGTDVGRGIAVDGNNNVYVAGYTDSFVFPTTNPIQKEIDGRTTHTQGDERFDAYLAKIDASGQFRVYSTYIGGHRDDVGLGVAVDALGYAYVTGWTESTEIDPSATPEPNRIEEFTIPQPFLRPGFIAVGPDNQIYFGDVDAQSPGRLGRLNIQPDPTATPTFEQFTFDPSEGFDGCQSVGDMTTNPFPPPSPSPAPDTNSIYFTDSCNNRLGRIDTNGNATDLTGPLSGCTSQITNNPNGNIYYTDSCSSRFFRYNPSTSTNTEFGSSCGPTYGITTGPDGNIYILDNCGQIEKVDPATGSVTNTYFTGHSFGSLSTITSGPDGNLYFTTGNSNGPVIGQFNPTLGSLNFFNIPTGHAAQGITAGPDGNIYFTLRDGHRIGRLEIATGAIREFRLPTCDAQPRDIVAGPDGNLYFTEEDSIKIGRYKLNPLTPDPAPLNCPPDPLFPITEGAFQQNPGGTGFTRDAFVTKVSADGSQYIYSTFLGGADEDVGWGIAVGSDRSAFVTGYTDSGAPTPPQRTNGPTPTPAPLQNDFPTTANAFQPQNNGGYDAFLSRLDPNGASLIYSTYIGGDQNEGDGGGECLSCVDRFDGAAVAVDFANNAYITGWTESTFVEDPGDRPNEPPPFINFPIKDAAQPDPGSSPGSFGSVARDAFVCKFNTDASGDNSLVFSTFLGGSHQDEGEGIAVDPAANAYVTGWTQSGSSCSECGGPPAPVLALGPNDFPTTAGAFQEESSDRDDGFVAKIAGGGFGIIGEGQGFIISGKVTLADDGSPVAGVTITLERPDSSTTQTTTDVNGIYSFSNVAPAPEDPYTVTPSGDPYIYTPPSQEVIIVNQNQRADFVASLPPEPTPTPTPEPTATPSPSATPTAPPASQALNLSTRLHVLTGDQVGIGGFIITGNAPKHVIVRAIGPDLTRFGIPNPLPDPVLELHGPGTFQTITNNNWRDTQEAQIKASGIPPTNDLESAIDVVLNPGNYTGIIRGNGGQTGIGLIEVYDLDTAAASKLSNISTRGFVGSTPGDAIIAGFILGNSNAPDRIVVRGLGPSLTSKGVPNVLQNPTLELHNGDGALLVTNNDWKDNPANAAEIVLANLAPSDDRESAIAVTLPPGVYTAILAGLQNTTGNGLVEIYDRGAAP